MTTNEIEELKIKIGDIIDGLEGHCQRRTVDDIGTIILAYGEKCREEERERIKDLIHDSVIQKNERNEMMYAVEIDNYNMALDDLLKVIEIV